jgi:hypothetical protein
LIIGKIKASQPKNVKTEKPLEPTYIRYTPGQQGEAYNSGAKQRIIRMVEMPIDPMEPPKFRHKKIPRGEDHHLFFITICYESCNLSYQYILIKNRPSITTCTSDALTTTESYCKRTTRVGNSTVYFKLEKCQRIHNTTRQTFSSRRKRITRS